MSKRTYKVQFSISEPDKNLVEKKASLMGFNSVPALMKFLFVQFRENNIQFQLTSKQVANKYLNEVEVQRLFSLVENSRNLPLTIEDFEKEKLEDPSEIKPEDLGF